MKTQYLLPCSCGQTVAVETSQAGDSVTCACGQRLDVPSLRGLRQLETVASEPMSAPAAEKNNGWGLRQGIMFSGLLLMLFSAIPGVYLITQLPTKPQLDVAHMTALNHEQIDAMPIDQLWMIWNQDILGRGLIEYPSPDTEHYEATRRRLLRWIYASFGVTCCGVGLVLVGLLVVEGRGLGSEGKEARG